MQDTTIQKQEMTKAQIIVRLQELGVENVNPNLKKEELLAILDKRDNGETTTGFRETVIPSPLSDTDKILSAIGGIASRLDSVEKEVSKMKDGGVNAFKEGATKADVEAAAKSREGVDPKIVDIVEKTLGTDFGIEINGYTDKPGFLFSLLVPERLSSISRSFRPVRDLETGAYKIDPKTMRKNPATGLPEGQVLEEEYWPGDRRSRALGSSDSYSVIQEHCNRVRSYILSYYQKTNKPQPEFRTR